MRLSTMLRISPAVWVSPFLTLLALMVTNTVPPDWGDSYLLALTAGSTSALFFIVPICAACAAWEGGRLRRAGWFTLPHVRPPVVVAGWAVAPVLLVGLLVFAIVVTFRLLATGVAGLPDLRVVGTAGAVIVAHTLLGFAIGLSAPTVVAVPAVFLVIFGWMVMPDTIEPLWLRHLTGSWDSCCRVAADLAPQALTGALALAGGLAATALLLMRQPLTAFGLALAVAPTVIGMSAGTFLVRGLGPDPEIARDPAALVCASSRPRVCVWPEHRERLEEVTAIAVQASTAWREAGVIVPAEFSERMSPTPGERSFGFNMRADEHTILNALAYSTLPPWPRCAIEGTGSYLGAAAEDYVLAWLDATAGMPAKDLANQFHSEVLDTIEAVRALPAERQQAWLERNLAALERCDLAPQLEPGA